MSDSSGEDSQDSRALKKAKNAMELQRMQLEKLMQNPEKEVIIPEVDKDLKLPRAFNPHQFVRNVMGASAGAGSGEFDIYRGCRRRELIRQEFLEEQAQTKKENEEFEAKRLANLKAAEEKTAKKRAKRLKAKSKKKKGPSGNNKKDDESEEENDEEEEENNEIIDLEEKEPTQAPVGNGDKNLATTSTT